MPVLRETGRSGAVAVRRGWPLLSGLMAVLLILLVGLLQPPVIAFVPGPTENVVSNIRVAGAGAPSFAQSAAVARSAGALDLTTVDIEDRLSLYGVLLAQLNGHVELFPRAAIFPPGQSSAESALLGLAQMQSAKDAAIAVALRLLGLPAPTPAGALVIGALPGTGAFGRLQAQDRVVAVGQETVTDVADLHAALQRYRPGEQVRLAVIRAGRRLVVQFRAGSAPGAPRLAYLGVVAIDALQTVPNVQINTGLIGGPSAGLMLTLGIYERLSGRDLTGGRVIAGTGTISGNGAVGPIGGVREKVVGARRAGATVFFVPVGNLAHARSARPAGLELVPVTTVSQALSWLLHHPLHGTTRGGR